MPSHLRARCQVTCVQDATSPACKMPSHLRARCQVTCVQDATSPACRMPSNLRAGCQVTCVQDAKSPACRMPRHLRAGCHVTCVQDAQHDLVQSRVGRSADEHVRAVALAGPQRHHLRGMGRGGGGKGRGGGGEGAELTEHSPAPRCTASFHIIPQIMGGSIHQVLPFRIAYEHRASSLIIANHLLHASKQTAPSSVAVRLHQVPRIRISEPR